jgi:putative transposase
MGRGATVRIVLTPEEKHTLTMWSKAGTTEQRLAQRARVILASAQGLDLPEVVRQSGLSRQNCSKWRRRFLAERLSGLQDRPRKGRALSISPELRLKVTALACTKPQDGSNAWTLRKLERALGVSDSPVSTCISSWTTWPLTSTGRLPPGLPNVVG